MPFKRFASKAIAEYNCWNLVMFRVNLAVFCETQRGPRVFCRIALAGGRGAERCSGLERVRVQLPPRSPTPLFRSSHLPVPSSCPSFTTTPVDAAGKEPGWSWTTARRRHQGPRAGGGPAREAAPEAGPGSPAPRPARRQSPKSH